MSIKYWSIIYLVLFFTAIWSSAENPRANVPTGKTALGIVVIDAGHGGMDPGAVAGGIREKDLVLDIALRLGKKINTAFPDVKVVYTRNKDVFVPLHTRADIANKNKADVFISLHANYVAATSVGGTETFTLGLHRSLENLEVAKKENSVILLEEDYTTNYEGFNPNETESYIMFENMQAEYQAQSIDLAAHIQEQFAKALKLPNRGVKQAGFLVLRNISMPGVLVEIGFISNPAERKFITSEQGKEQLTQSIFNAFSEYKRNIDDRSRFNTQEPEQPGTVAARPQTPPTAEVLTKPAAQTGEKQAEKPVVSQNQPVPPPNRQSTENNPKPNSTPVQKKQETQTQAQKISYGVQIAAGGRLLDPSPANFKGEKKVSRYKVGNLYKYVAGDFSTPEEAFNEQNRLKSKFPGAFIVVIENNIPLPVKLD